MTRQTPQAARGAHLSGRDFTQLYCDQGLDWADKTDIPAQAGVPRNKIHHPSVQPTLKIEYSSTPEQFEKFRVPRANPSTDSTNKEGGKHESYSAQAASKKQPSSTRDEILFRQPLCHPTRHPRHGSRNPRTTGRKQKSRPRVPYNPKQKKIRRGPSFKLIKSKLPTASPPIPPLPPAQISSISSWRT